MSLGLKLKLEYRTRIEYKLKYVNLKELYEK